MRERVSLKNIEANRHKVGKIYMLTCALFYILSVAAKGIFAAEIHYIRDIWKLNEMQVELANTLYFITYGLVQIILFIFMEKINIVKYAFVTVPISAAVSIAMGLVSGIKGIWVLFALVGVFQAGMWCGCNYLVTKYVPRKLLPSANKLLASGYAIGTAISFVVSSFFIGLNMWRVPYFILGGMLLVCTAVLIYQTKLISRYIRINKKLDIKQMMLESKENNSNDLEPLTMVEKPIFSLSSKKRKVIFYTAILLVSFLLNGLYYGAMSFVTRVLSDIYALPKDVSGYITTIVPIIIILGPLITINSCEKHKDFIKVAIKYLFIILPLPILLIILYDKSIVLYIALIVVYLILANGIRVILNNVVGFKMKDYINVAAFVALINAFASISASIWPLIIAYIKDNGTWGATYWAIAIMVVVVLLATIVIDLLVRRIYKKDNNGQNLEK